MKSGIGLAVAKGCSTNALQLEKINHLSSKKKLAQYPTPTRLGPTRISIAIGGHDPANSHFQMNSAPLGRKNESHGSTSWSHSQTRPHSVLSRPGKLRSCKGQKFRQKAEMTNISVGKITGKITGWQHVENL